MFIQLQDHAPAKLIQPWKLPALGEQLESAPEGGHTQSGLPGKDPGATGLEVKERGARSTAGSGFLGNLLEELPGTPVFPFVECKIRFLQDRRDILGKRFADVAAEYAAHYSVVSM
jgi:hypothetical protein